VPEYDLAIAFHVLVEPNAGASFGQHHFQRGLTALQRITAQIVAVQLDRIEGVEEDVFVVVAIANEIERSYAVVIAVDRLAIDDAEARVNAGQRIHDQRKPMCEMIAGAAIE
jgi:hypothetical protein